MGCYPAHAGRGPRGRDHGLESGAGRRSLGTVRYHLIRLRAERRTERLTVSRQHTAARRALTYRPKLAWAAAAATIKVVRPARAPPPGPGMHRGVAHLPQR